jgi:hypothetical protein
MTIGSFDPSKISLWAPLQVGQEFNAKIFEFASVNAGSGFKFVAKLSSVKSPEQFTDLVTSHATENFKLLMDEFDELLAIVKKSSIENGEEAGGAIGD